MDDIAQIILGYTGDWNTWAEFGLAGLVIAALFTGIAIMFSRLMRKLDSKDAQVLEILKESREERRELAETNTKAVNKLSTAIKSLTAELRKN